MGCKESNQTNKFRSLWTGESSNLGKKCWSSNLGHCDRSSHLDLTNCQNPHLGHSDGSSHFDHNCGSSNLGHSSNLGLNC